MIILIDCISWKNSHGRINKNLEEQIETIYNSFFVYYDDFSKEELEECEIGLIPKDWELMSLGEVTTKIKEKVGSDDYKVILKNILLLNKKNLHIILQELILVLLEGMISIMMVV